MIGIRRYVDNRFDALTVAHQSLRDADVTATLVAKDDLSRRLDGMNEFRRALSDQTATFIPRAEAEATWRRNSDRLDQLTSQHRDFISRPEHEALAERISSLDSRLTRIEGAALGSEAQQSRLRSTIIVSVAIAGLLLTLVLGLLSHVIK